MPADIPVENLEIVAAKVGHTSILHHLTWNRAWMSRLTLLLETQMTAPREAMASARRIGGKVRSNPLLEMGRLVEV